jgi:hypothetical protein
MDGKIDKKTEEMLIRALEGVKSYGQQWQVNREKGLWKEVNILPCSDSKPTLILQYLQSWLEFPSFEFVQVLAGKIIIPVSGR